MAPSFEKSLRDTPQPELLSDQRRPTCTVPSSITKKGIVVGLYGVPGSGKTFLLNQLERDIGEQHFAFYEGSKKIASLIPGGLDAFQNLPEHEKVEWRKLAIKMIGEECAQDGRVGVVAGHFMFWSEGEADGRTVMTRTDLDTFTHILYLDVPDDVVLQRRFSDTGRSRPETSIDHLSKWQLTEKTELRRLCLAEGILFSLVSPQPTLLSKVSMLLHDFQVHDEEHNLSCGQNLLKTAVAAQMETMLVLDADRTLAAVDTGTLFWDRVASRGAGNESHPLKSIFGSSMGYSYTAFRQATLLYEEMSDLDFEAICQEVAAAVTMYPEFVSLLQRVSKEDHVGAVIISCGLRRVWEKVLEREGLSETVKIIGGGRISDGMVVTATLKAALVGQLQTTHHSYTWAFGDSPLDLPMLSQADRGIVVVGVEQERSRSMDAALAKEIDIHGLQIHQALLPSSVSPRLDTTRLPLVQLQDFEFLASIFCRRSRYAALQILHATSKNATKLLMTPMRDANVAGPVLRESHRRVGRYLATEFLPSLIGIEEYPIPHVQGQYTSGYRLLDEQKTSIVALMRGGEPMAFGVSEVFPLAMFIHASCPEDIKAHHLEGQATVLLVDSVVNNGKTVLEVEEHIRRLHTTIRLVVVAGVVQARSISEGGMIHSSPRRTGLSLVALRLSENKFTGKGTTDTGNRLFNTTHVA